RCRCSQDMGNTSLVLVGAGRRMLATRYSLPKVIRVPRAEDGHADEGDEHPDPEAALEHHDHDDPLDPAIAAQGVADGGDGYHEDALHPAAPVEEQEDHPSPGGEDAEDPDACRALAKAHPAGIHVAGERLLSQIALANDHLPELEDQQD